MGNTNVSNSTELRTAIQLAGPGDTITLVGAGPFSVGTLAKLTSTTLPTNPGGGYSIIGNPSAVVEDTRIYQDNIDGANGPSVVQDLTFEYTDAALNTTAILRATSGAYTISGVDFLGTHSGWSGNSSTYISLTVSSPLSPTTSSNNSTLVFSNNNVAITGQGSGPGGSLFTGTTGGSAFIQSFNNQGGVTLNGNVFDEAGYLSSFNFFNSSTVSSLGAYSVTNNTFTRSSNQTVRTRGNRLENVSVALSGNTFSDGAFLDLLGNISGVTFGANTFNTIANGFGIRLTNPVSGTPLTGNLPFITGSIVFTGAGLPLKLVNATNGSFKTLENSTGTTGATATITVNGLVFDRLTAGGQGNDNLGSSTGAYRDWINGDDGNDTINGFANADYMIGGNGTDSISGGSGGNDTLVGGIGNDTLIGGGGADVFRYESQAEGTDIITDFTIAQSDKLQFVGSAFGGLAAGALNAANFVSGTPPVAGAAIPTFLFNTTTRLLSFDADGTGGGAAVNIATLNTVISNTDIVIV
ncbi:MAG: calcium-binding protein [Cyanobacteriota bacterium]|jgi:Ca2+-binding RTX toxin-like protein